VAFILTLLNPFRLPFPETFSSALTLTGCVKEKKNNNNNNSSNKTKLYDMEG